LEYESSESIFESSSRYISKNAIATRVQIYRDDAIVAFPRFRPGVPITLARTSLKHRNSQSTFSAFPFWGLQAEGNCQTLQSVVDVFLDANDTVWVLDVGIVNTLEQSIRRCPPKIMSLCVKTGKVLNVIELSSLVSHASRLQYLVVDYSRDGRHFVYVSDATTRAVLVYDVAYGKGYRAVLPKSVTRGFSRRDVLYLALLRRPCGTTVLMFTYLSSKRLFSIETEHLWRGSIAGRVQDLGPKPGKFVFIGTDGGSALFLRLEGDGSIYRWDTTSAFRQENFLLVYRSRPCAMPTHVVADNKHGHLRVLESNFHDYLEGAVGCGVVQSLSVLQ
jgi:hypothetical protein